MSALPLSFSNKITVVPLDASGCVVCWNDHTKLLGKEGIHAWSLILQQHWQKVMGQPDFQNEGGFLV